MDLRFAIEENSSRLSRTLLERTSAHRWSLKELGYQLNRLSPAARIQVDRQRVDDLTRRGETRLSHRMEIQRARILSLEQRLGSLNPIGILERGFAVITQTDGTVIRKVAQAVPGEQLNLRVSDGSFSAEVLDEG
jgi:exodeoxyribonuclease VII large subunit